MKRKTNFGTKKGHFGKNQNNPTSGEGKRCGKDQFGTSFGGAQKGPGPQRLRRWEKKVRGERGIQDGPKQRKGGRRGWYGSAKGNGFTKGNPPTS